MEGVPIHYVMQPSVDDSLNVFFLPPAYKSLNEVKIKDVIAHFPLKDTGRYFHYRFYALCDKDQKTWVDISNMGAKAPVVENRILLKVLEVEKPHYSKLFSKAPRDDSNGRSEPRPEVKEQPSQYSNQRPTRNGPGDVRQPSQPTTQVTSPPKEHQAQPKPTVSSPTTNVDHYEDLLGGDHSEPVYSGPKTDSTNSNIGRFTPPADNRAPTADNSALHNMTHDQLSAYKQQKMDQAIQDKLNFANKIWQDEDKIKQDKEKAYFELEESVKRWSGKNNQRNNIRALLCTLHEVLWQGADWTPLSLSDLMMPAQIKKNYFKALTKFHPDKNQEADYRQRYIAERVTNELNAAWDEFRKTNPV